MVSSIELSISSLVSLRVTSSQDYKDNSGRDLALEIGRRLDLATSLVTLHLGSRARSDDTVGVCWPAVVCYSGLNMPNVGFAPCLRRVECRSLTARSIYCLLANAPVLESIVNCESTDYINDEDDDDDDDESESGDDIGYLAFTREIPLKTLKLDHIVGSVSSTIPIVAQCHQLRVLTLYTSFPSW